MNPTLRAALIRGLNVIETRTAQARRHLLERDDAHELVRETYDAIELVKGSMIDRRAVIGSEYNRRLLDLSREFPGDQQLQHDITEARMQLFIRCLNVPEDRARRVAENRS